MRKSAAKKLFTGKFFKSINVSLSVSIIMIIILMTVISYYSSESLILDRENESNKQIMNQVMLNIKLMDESVKSTCKNLFNDEAAISLMYNDFDDDIIDLNFKLRTLNTRILENGFIESIYVYNYSKDEFYSYTEGIINDKSMFQEELKASRVIPILKPVVLKKNIFRRPSDSKGEKLLSYFIYENTDEDGKPTGALIVNIKSGWLVNNLLEPGNENQNDNSVFIFNDDGGLLGQSGTGVQDDYLRQLFGEYKSNNYSFNGNKNYVRQNINGVDYLVTLLHAQAANMVILKMQKYQDVFKGVDRLRLNVILLTLVFLSLAIILSRLVSRRIYRPLGNLVSKLDLNNHADTHVKYHTDEFAYIDEIFIKSRKKINNLEKDKIEFRRVLKSAHLKKLLFDGGEIKEDEILRMWHENQINFNIKGNFAVCILRIDGYKSFEEARSLEERKLIKFAIINIACEILSEYANAEGVDLDDDKVALILNHKHENNTMKDFIKAFEDSIRLAQHYILKYYNISTSASMSEHTTDYTQISEVYVSALQNSYYRLIYGEQCIITADKIKSNNENMKTGISPEYERKLIEKINNGDLRGFMELFDKMKAETSELSYKNTILVLFKTADILKQAVENHKIKGSDICQRGLFELGQKVFELETMDEFYTKAIELMEAFFEKRNQYHEKEKYQRIAENIKEYINNNYEDKSICLAVISNNLNMSQAYVGRIFKGETGISVSEYINEKRLEQAAKLLEETSYPIIHILGKIGIENEKYFYSLFKKRFGVTPKEYMLRSKLNTQN